MGDFGFHDQTFIWLVKHCWSIMEGTTVMTNLRCGPDFPITPLPDLPGRCQNQSLQKKSIEYSQRAAAHPGKGCGVRRIGHTRHEVYTQPFERRLRDTEIQTRGEMLCGSWLGLGWRTQDDLIFEIL